MVGEEVTQYWLSASETQQAVEFLLFVVVFCRLVSFTFGK